MVVGFWKWFSKLDSISALRRSTFGSASLYRMCSLDNLDFPSDLRSLERGMCTWFFRKQEEISGIIVVAMVIAQFSADSSTSIQIRDYKWSISIRSWPQEMADPDGIDLSRKAKTARGKRILKKRAPQVCSVAEAVDTKKVALRIETENCTTLWT